MRPDGAEAGGETFMPQISKAALLAAALIGPTTAASAERTTTTTREAFVCVSWAAWREYGLASLTARGARMSPSCPLRLSARTKVVIVDDDAGAGATEIRYRGKTWFVDSQRLK
jgi:hypothetical protein